MTTSITTAFRVTQENSMNWQKSWKEFCHLQTLASDQIRGTEIYYTNTHNYKNVD